MRKANAQPPAPELILYEYEASPYCRRVRETLCVLGLPALIKPCPRETLQREGAYSRHARNKPEILSQGGRLLFPFLVDATAGVQLNESREIVEHLWRTYGGDVIERPASDTWLNSIVDPPGLPPSRVRLPRPVDFALLALPSAVRAWPSAGLMAASASKPAEAPLVLHGHEHCEGTRLVRELLCQLELEYRSVPVEAAYAGRTPRPLPHFEDPATGFVCFGAAHALSYLNDAYRRGPTLGLAAPVPEPNLGDSDRTSWLSHALAIVPQRLLDIMGQGTRRASVDGDDPEHEPEAGGGRRRKEEQLGGGGSS